MSVFGQDYAKYYDLLYDDKNYKGEVDYIDTLIKKYLRTAVKSVLDVGCGTGRHLQCFKDLGYKVAGVDFSEKMIESARINLGSDAMLCCADSADFKLTKKFDAAVSLFHVMSYQTTNDALEKTLQNINRHLRKGGLFIFDYWYGPTVLRELPTERIKRFENETFIVTRQSTPAINYTENCVSVNFDVDIESKRERKSDHINELHKMRYFFIPELEYILSQCGFSPLTSLSWMGQESPVPDKWYAVSVSKKV